MELLIYQAKVAVCFAVLYLCFRLFLSKERLHGFNRVMLLLSAVISIVLPLCRITIHKTLPYIPSSVIAGVPAEISAGVPLEAQAEPGPSVWQILPLYLYLAGAAFFLLRMLLSILSLVGIIRGGRVVQQADGSVVVISPKLKSAMSWMKYIFLPNAEAAPENEWILNHEKAHVRFRHSWDILFTDIFTAMQWFNPAAWMMQEDLRSIHEYEADSKVLESGIDAKQYQLLLVKKAVAESSYSVSNSFNHGKLKKRIFMMQLKKTSPGKALKALYVLPLVLIGIASNAKTVYDLQDVRVVSVTDTLRIHGTGTQGKNMEIRTVVINGKEADTEILQTMPAGSISSVTINKEDGDAKVYIVTVTDTLSNRNTETQEQDKQRQKIIIGDVEFDLEKLQSMFGESLPSLDFSNYEFDFEKFQSLFGESMPSWDFGDSEFDLEKLRSMLGWSISSETIDKEEGDGKVQVVTVVGTRSGDSGDSSSESSEQVARIILNGTVHASELGSAAREVADLVKVYVDGENVDISEFNSLDTENIESIEVDKQGEIPVIKVTLKNSAD